MSIVPSTGDVEPGVVAELLGFPLSQVLRGARIGVFLVLGGPTHTTSAQIECKRQSFLSPVIDGGWRAVVIRGCLSTVFLWCYTSVPVLQSMKDVEGSYVWRNG
eukprot:9730529-Heterocapsa_arctica.AAC.1